MRARLARRVAAPDAVDYPNHAEVASLEEHRAAAVEGVGPDEERAVGEGVHHHAAREEVPRTV